MTTKSKIQDLSKFKPNKITERAINELKNGGGTRYSSLEYYLQKRKKPK